MTKLNAEDTMLRFVGVWIVLFAAVVISSIWSDLYLAKVCFTFLLASISVGMLVWIFKLTGESNE